MSFQGIEFTPDMREMAVNVKLFFDNLKSNADFLNNPATKLAASALGISESTVKVIMAAYNVTTVVLSSQNQGDFFRHFQGCKNQPMFS